MVAPGVAILFANLMPGFAKKQRAAAHLNPFSK
jgi:hypothetical protein